MVRIVFEAETDYGVFRDAITLEDDHTLTDADIELIKQERISNWIQIVSMPQVDNGN